MVPKILVNPDILSPSFIPEKLLHRNNELNELSTCIENSVNAFVCGSFGSGKTTLVKRLAQAYNNEERIAYVDCYIYPSTYSILKGILPASDLMVYRSNYELARELQKFLDSMRKRKFTVCMDDFERMKDKELIAKLMSMGICLILVSDSDKYFKMLDDRIKSNITTAIEIPPYTFDQAYDILKDRADVALECKSCSNSILKKIATGVNGNVTLAINSLKSAALTAEGKGRDWIEDDDIPSIKPMTPRDKLSEDEQILLEILEEHNHLQSAKLYDLYRERAEFPKLHRSFRNYMENLCMLGFVKPVGDKRGRTYKIVKAD